MPVTRVKVARKRHPGERKAKCHHWDPCRTKVKDALV